MEVNLVIEKIKKYMPNFEFDDDYAWLIKIRCNKCGFIIEDAQQDKYCPNCGNILTSKNVYY